MVVAGGIGKVCRCIEVAAERGDLVCDGRLVVDAAFRTNDTKILAAGTGAKFSRRSPSYTLPLCACAHTTAVFL